MDRFAAVNQLKAVYGILAADLDAAVALGRQADTQFARRTLFRVSFALIEGLSFQMRQVTLASLKETGLLSHAEVSLLAEERHSLGKDGKPTAHEQFLRFPESVVFSIECYAKNHGANFIVDRSNNGWGCLRKASKVRNLITHPKAENSLTVRDEDAKHLQEGFIWWKGTVMELFAACDEADTYWRNKLTA